MDGNAAEGRSWINDKYPAGILTLKGSFVDQHKAEILNLATHQEEAEKGEHPFNRIVTIEQPRPTSW